MNLTGRASYQSLVKDFLVQTDEEVLGSLASHHKNRALEQQQINAWRYQITHLRDCLKPYPDAVIFLEFEIPRIGKRADAVLVLNGNILVVEYKVGATSYDASSIDQVHDYALDLKNFHLGSHYLKVVPILIATNAPDVGFEFKFDADDVAEPVLTNEVTFTDFLKTAFTQLPSKALDVSEWVQSIYQPTPTIIEAAKALYKGHGVQEISRSDAGAVNLSRTSNLVSKIIDEAKQNKQKVICLITGVPGSGKTLAGLNIATQRMRVSESEHAVFLSGNGPLVAVLREALVQDELKGYEGLPRDERVKRSAIDRKANAFIQNIHHFRDYSFNTTEAPVEKVVIFDEAQRAWNKHQTSAFMKKKHQVAAFDMSEPEFLLSVMDRHDDWCVVICLVGEGQEINTGELGIGGWFSALEARFKDWKIYCSDRIDTSDYLPEEGEASLPISLDLIKAPDLHLAVSLRSFRAENLSHFVAAVVNGEANLAKELMAKMPDYPILLTRDLNLARQALRGFARGTERTGMVASSNAMRLKPEGLFVKNEIDPTQWFLKGKDDIRSSFYLEDVATEFHVQGLEIDWACMCWDANFRIVDGKWKAFDFSGTKWRNVNAEWHQYITNAYRVLLTRARQGLIIYIPKGEDGDLTRPKSFYDPTYDFLVSCGIPTL